MYINNNSFYIKSYQFGHSKLTMESLEAKEDLQIIFEGVEYFEVNRIYNGLEITQLAELEKTLLLEKRKELRKNNHLYLKIESKNQNYFVACLSIRVISEGKIVFSEYLH